MGQSYVDEPGVPPVEAFVVCRNFLQCEKGFVAQRCEYMGVLKFEKSLDSVRVQAVGNVSCCEYEIQQMLTDRNGYATKI